MRAVFAICLLLTSLTVVHAQAVQRIDIMESGIYATDTESSTAEPGTASGRVEQVANIRLVQSTTVVPARLGVEFGFRYKIVGPADAKVSLKNVTRIPAPGIRNPETGNVTVTSVFSQEHKVGEELYRLYRLTDTWEIVPGMWIMELWDGDRKLASQSFQIVKK